MSHPIQQDEIRIHNAGSAVWSIIWCRDQDRVAAVDTMSCIERNSDHTAANGIQQVVGSEVKFRSLYPEIYTMDTCNACDECNYKG